jgi:hypothetical protein
VAEATVSFAHLRRGWKPRPFKTESQAKAHRKQHRNKIKTDRNQNRIAIESSAAV